MLVFVQRKALRTQSTETTLNSRLGELNNSIPFLCTGLEFNHLNFTERLIKSVDYPIKHFVIILAGFDPSVRRLARWITESFRQVHVVWQSSRIGGTGVFNVCLRYMQEFYGEEWGLIVNNDVYFPSGSLMCMKNKTEQVLKEDPNLCLGFVSFRNMHFGFSAFVATSRLLQYAGYFDENLFPAYYDDNEIDIRLRRVNSVGEVCTRRDIVFKNGFHHGTEEQQGYLSGTVQYLNQHKESSFSDAQRRGSRNNPKYVARKWGCIGTNWDSCNYTRPFNKDFLNVKDWKFDPLYRICIEHGKFARNEICTYDTELLSSLKQAER